MESIACAMALVVIMDGGLWLGDFKSGFAEICWGKPYSTNLEVIARYKLARGDSIE